VGNNTAVAEKFTSPQLALMPDDGKRYEIVDGELYVSRQPSYEHQYTCSLLTHFLVEWNLKSEIGAVFTAPGLIFGEYDDVAPDVVWMSRDRLSDAADEAGHLTVAPELVIEVLSPGKANQERDRKVKLNLYSRRGVDEYWIVSWIQRFVEVYRREDATLKFFTTFVTDETITTPLLPGFSCEVRGLF